MKHVWIFSFLVLILPLATVSAEPIPCTDGMADVYPCSNIDLIAHMPLSEIGGDTSVIANDLWGWTDPETGKEYALQGRADGTAFIDISDAENPVYLGILPTQSADSSWRDLKTYQNHVYIVSEAAGHGMQVFDLTQLRDVTDPQTFSITNRFNQFGSSHNIVINEDSGYAYSVGTTTCGGGLHMMDISNAPLVRDAGCFREDGYTHDAQCVIYNGSDLDHIGKEICFNSNEDSLTIVDVTDKETPMMLSREIGFTGCVLRDNCYTHQGWLTEDQTMFLVDDELDEINGGNPSTTTYVWNVTDLDAPVLVETHGGVTPSIDHNQYVRGNLTYQSNYRSGLRVLDIDAESNALTEVAFFDVYPDDDNPEFDGTWSNYPYFESENIIVSSIERGLFVLKADFTDAADFSIKPASITDVVIDSCKGASHAIPFAIDRVYDPETTAIELSTVLPDGITADMPDANTADSQTVTFTVGADAEPSPYLLTVNATNGRVDHTEYLRINVRNADFDVAEQACSEPTAVSTSNITPTTSTPLLILLTTTFTLCLVTLRRVF